MKTYVISFEVTSQERALTFADLLRDEVNALSIVEKKNAGNVTPALTWTRHKSKRKNKNKNIPKWMHKVTESILAVVNETPHATFHRNVFTNCMKSAGYKPSGLSTVLTKLVAAGLIQRSSRSHYQAVDARE